MKYPYLFIPVILLFISSHTIVSAASQSGAKTTIIASLPAKTDIRVFGYTAPNSIVQATSIRVFAQVSTDNTGYFLIDPLPISNEAKEICLATIDAERRIGFPVCISLPKDNKPTEIGPLLLSPTISLSHGSLTQNQKAEAVGMTLPESEVEISFFENSTSWRIGQLSGVLRLIRQAEAKEVPKITTKTDSNGSYSINLPVAKPVTYRLFARSFYQKNPTPKSQTLLFSISSYTDYWLTNILPKIILLFLLLILSIWLAKWEGRTKRIRVCLYHFSERSLKPFGLRIHLRLRRLLYDHRQNLR